MQWVTRQHASIDRFASLWLIRRFIDRDSEFLFVPETDVRRVAASTGAIPYGVPGVDLWRGGGSCFDVLRAKYGLEDAPLRHIAAILRAVDNDNAADVPEAAGLRAILIGLAKSVRDEQERLAHGVLMCEALYDWARETQPGIRGRPESGISLWFALWRERRHLADLDARMLRDVGLTRADARRESAKPFWKH